jgi:hypothetical protein
VLQPVLRNTKTILCQITLPLFLGILVYALLRKEPPFGYFLPWRKPIFDVSYFPHAIYAFVVYRLPDMLWTFSFISALDMQLKKASLSAVIVTTIFILYEYCQHTNVLNGTGDFGDVFFSLCSVIAYILFFRRERK